MSHHLARYASTHDLSYLTNATFKAESKGTNFESSVYMEQQQDSQPSCSFCMNLMDNSSLYTCADCGDKFCKDCAYTCNECDDLFCPCQVNECTNCACNYCSICSSIRCCVSCCGDYCDQCTDRCGDCGPVCNNCSDERVCSNCNYTECTACAEASTDQQNCYKCEEFLCSTCARRTVCEDGSSICRLCRLEQEKKPGLDSAKDIECFIDRALRSVMLKRGDGTDEESVQRAPLKKSKHCPSVVN